MLKVSYFIILLLMITPVYAFDNTTIFCVDNTTMLENITVYKDGNSSSYGIYTTCYNGCDNNTVISLTGSLCNPDEITQYIVLIMIVVALILLYKWASKRG